MMPDPNEHQERERTYIWALVTIPTTTMQVLTCDGRILASFSNVGADLIDAIAEHNTAVEVLKQAAKVQS